MVGEQKHEVVDVGATGLDPEDDFVDYAAPVAEEVAENGEAREFCSAGTAMG